MVTEKPSAETEKQMRTAESVQQEISGLLRQLASPVVAGESVKTCIRRASMRSGLPYGQVKRAWYREWREIPAHIADTIREIAGRHDRKLKRSMFQAVAAMQDTDPEFFRRCIEDTSLYLFPDREQASERSPVD